MSEPVSRILLAVLQMLKLFGFNNVLVSMMSALTVWEKQLKAVVVKYLNDHPEEQHKPASELVIFALGKAFPPESDAK